jgi:hypothetical protein
MDATSIDSTDSYERNHMTLSRRTLRLAPLAAVVALAASAPAAVAAPWEGSPSGATCGNTIGDQGQGQTGGNDTLVCGSGTSQIAPQNTVTSTVGPVIVGAAGGVVITTTGNVTVVL